MADIVAMAATDRWIIIVGFLGLTVVVGFLAGALILSVREAVKEHRVAAHRVRDVRAQVETIMTRRDRRDVEPSVPAQRIPVSGRADASKPGRRQDAPSATALRDSSTVT